MELIKKRELRPGRVLFLPWTGQTLFVANAQHIALDPFLLRAESASWQSCLGENCRESFLQWSLTSLDQSRLAVSCFHNMGISPKISCITIDGDAEFFFFY